MRKNTFYIKRGLEKEILPYLDSPEIIAIIGSRQCGKTTLVQHITKELKGKTVNFLDFEDRDELNLFINDIKAFIKLHVEGKDYLIIDEFQYAIDGGKQLKYIYDSCQIKIIITGSSATELSIQSIRHLVGRIFVFVLYPFSFDEFLSFRNPALSQLAEEKPAFEFSGHSKDKSVLSGICDLWRISKSHFGSISSRKRTDLEKYFSDLSSEGGASNSELSK